MEPSTAASQTIGFIAASLAGSYYRTVLAGVYEVVRRRGLRLVVIQGSTREIAATRLACDTVGGWVAVFDTDGVEQLAGAGVPIVTVSRRVGGAPAVLSDNYGGMQAAVRHLTRLGHRRIAFVGSQGQNSDIPERLAGYRDALSEAGVPFDEQLVFFGPDDNLNGGQVAAAAMLQAGISWTAIAAATDLNAVGLMGELRRAGYRFPHDLAIVGFDDMPEAQVTDPPLTTVRLRFDEMGRIAAERLLAQIADPSLPADTVAVATALVVRRSCGSAAPDREAPGEAPVAAAGWEAPLARRMTQALIYPLPLAADADPAAQWPGAATLTGALAAALDGAPQPDPGDNEFESAWQSATKVAVYTDALADALDEIERAADALLDARPHTDGRQTDADVRATLRRMRRALLRVVGNASTTQLGYLEHTIETGNTISRELSSGDPQHARELRWLRHTLVTWGCLGLWDSATPGALTLAGIYEQRRAQQPAGQRLDACKFPPLALAPPREDDADVITIAPVRTARRDWGVLALATTYSNRVSFVDSLRMWAELLGARLDDDALFQELEQQRAVLQQAYDRERALADTVRELGCPVIPISGALLVPLIGLIDSARAQQIIDAVLASVGAHRAAHVLLDVTGVPLIDTQVASVLVQLAQMARMLGARSMLIGVRPEIAQSIVSLGVDLREIQAQPSLEAALQALRS